jgi:hypothetical protein
MKCRAILFDRPSGFIERNKGTTTMEYIYLLIGALIGGRRNLLPAQIKGGPCPSEGQRGIRSP